MSKIVNLHQVDAYVANAISKVTGVANYHPVNYVAQKIRKFFEDEKKVDPPIFSPIRIVRNGVNAIVSYHSEVLRQSTELSDQLKNKAISCCTSCLSFIAFCRVGHAIQNAIAHDIFGNLVQCLSFIAIQIFHLFPYLVVSTIISASVTLYQTDPFALTSLFAGAMLTTQLLFLYQLIKTVERAEKVLDEKAEKMISAINLIEIFNNTCKSIGSHAKWGIKRTFSWIL